MDRETIKTAFREILKRDPDFEAVKFYGSTELGYEALCQELKGSEEYANRFLIPYGYWPKKTGGSPDLDWPFAQIFVAKNVKVVYSPIAKNACSTLKRLMVSISDIPAKDDLVNRGDIHKKTDQFNTGIQLKDLDPAEVDNAINGQDYFRFAVLRDPADRILSAYWEKFVKNRFTMGNLDHTKPVIRSVIHKEKLSQEDVSRGISFGEFLEFISSSEPGSLDPHWNPQHLYLEGIKYNHTYRIDQLDELYSRLSDITRQKIQPKEYNVTNSGVGKFVSGAEKMRADELEQIGSISKESFFTPKNMEIIEEYFRKDYDLINY